MSDTHDERGAVNEQAELAEAQATEIQAECNEWHRRAQRGHVAAEILRADVAAARRERDEAKAETANLNGCLMLFLVRYGNQTFHEGDVKRAAELSAALNATTDGAPK